MSWKSRALKRFQTKIEVVLFGKYLDIQRLITWTYND